MGTKFTKALTALVLSICFFAVRTEAFTAKISALEGEVDFKQGDTELWKEAEAGLSLTAGDKIRSSIESWAEISFSRGHMTRLGPGSHMKIAAVDQETNVELFNGELFSRVRELSSEKKFQINTPQAVASVKGTEFSVTVNQAPQVTLVKVFSGQVSLSDLEEGIEVLINAGYFSRVKRNEPPGAPQSLDQLEGVGDGDLLDEALAEDSDDEIAVADDEAPAEDDLPEAVDPRQAQQELRNEIRSAVNDIRTDIRQAQNVIEQKKESDSVTGRTLKDYHGNLVRVAQHLMRPEGDTLHFINITKRDNYNYRGRMNVKSTGARLDYFETKIKFNRRIPEKVSGWFDFMKNIAENEEDFHPETFDVKISNNADSINMRSEWDYAEDNMGKPDIYYISAREETKGRWDPVEGTDERGVSIDQGPEDGKFDVWAISPGVKFENSGREEYIRLGMEGWLINNEGKLFDIKSLEDGNINPFDIVRKIAFQMSLTGRYGLDDESYILDREKSVENTAENRREALEGFNKAEDFFSKNFDLVATPDTAFNIMEELAKNVDLSASAENQ